MKTLYNYILEAHGVVTGENDWSSTVDVIMDLLKRNPNEESFNVPEGDLPPWLKGLKVLIQKSSIYRWSSACYTPSNSSIVGDKLVGQIEITMNKIDPKHLKYVLNHEIQHAFDDWIIRVKRNTGTLSDFLYIPSGYSELRADGDPIKHIVKILEDPAHVTFNDLFIMFDQCTYFFSNTEINAYLREWALSIEDYVKETGSKELDFQTCLQNNQLEGYGPILIINVLYKILNIWDKIHIEDDDWEYVMGALNPRWTKRFIGKSIPGSGKDGVKNILQSIMDKYADQLIRKYNRIIKDKGIIIKNGPEWLK